MLDAPSFLWRRPVTIKAVDVLAGDILLATVEGNALDGIFAAGSGQTAVVGPRQTTTMILSAVTNPLPSKVDHRIHFRVGGDSHDTVVRYPGTPVEKNLLRLRPPVRGDSWVVLAGPGSNNHHTAGVLQFEGRQLVPQRFAIDFNRAYEDGELVHGDRTEVHNYRCYGAVVFAVADARVIFVRNDVPDNPGQANKPTLFRIPSPIWAEIEWSSIWAAASSPLTSTCNRGRCK